MARSDGWVWQRVVLAAAVLAIAGSLAADAGDRLSAEQQDQQEQQPQPLFRGSTQVVASRVAGSALDAGRSEVVLTRQQIEALPATTLQEVLALLPGLGLNRRGARGVQGDLSIRGGTFEQSVILVNGVRVNNSQTGHHNLDLFLPAAAIERIEVLFGPGSALYGPDAFGGAVNIVTAAPPSSGFVRVGSNHLAGGGLAAALRSGLWLALEREVHSGFRDDTEADVNQAAGGWRWSAGEATVDLLLSAGERHFGAWSFYSTAFPNQREWTEGQLLTLQASLPVGSNELQIAARADRHGDVFVLDRARPEWYQNRHTTRGTLLDVVLKGRLAQVDWALGLEAARDQITSSNLGRHHRTRSAAFAEVGGRAGRLSGGLQLRYDTQEPWGGVGLLAAGGSWQLAPQWRLRLYHGQSYRAPSFTELYYASPATVGNAELEPERGRTTEAGVVVGRWSLSLFRRSAHPVIDYLLGDDAVWRASNVGGVTTDGAEAAWELPASSVFVWQRVAATYLDSSVDLDPERSRYALAHPRFEAAWSGALAVGERWQAGWGVRWREPMEAASWLSVDLRLERVLERGLSIGLDATNVFDRDISELHGIPLPGRWLMLTVRYREEQT